MGTVVTSVSEGVAVRVGLVLVRYERTVVANVSMAIVVEVGLR